jgi:two-component system, NtrC family, sensor kinase
LVIKETDKSRRSLKIDYVLEDSESLLKESLEGADRVRRIVQDLKIFSRIDDTVYAPADINQVIESTINIAWNEIKFKASLNKHFDELPQVTCNSGQLSQVFMNILVNAAQAIMGFGEITIGTREIRGFVVVTISDNGPGIPAECINRIFEPFFTTKEIGKGTGLGLSVAYDIVKKHRGEIEVQSEAEKGTTFIVRIPVDSGIAMESAGRYSPQEVR